MASLFSNVEDVSIKIPSFTQQDSVTFYTIEIQVGPVQWSVKHRYSEFAELHEVLVQEHCVEKDILPPKKLIGNKNEAFVEKRKLFLENYLNFVFSYLKKAMPVELAVFLHLNIYDIHFLLQSMALKFYTDPPITSYYTFNPVQLYAISKRLKEPRSSLEQIDKKYDFSHVLDFASRLQELIINGLPYVYGSSNIQTSSLSIELSSFKSLEKLTIDSYPVNKIFHMGNLRDTVMTLNAHNVNIKNVTELVMCEEIHKDISNANDSHIWMKLVKLDLSDNQINVIDEAIRLMPYIECLKLNNNCLKEITNVTFLPRLSHLHLASNNFTTLPEDLHVKLGKIVQLDLSQNQLTSLAAFAKLYCLEILDMSCNQIEDIAEIKHIGNLPCLEHLRLTGNPVSTVVDYRVKALEPFGKRAADIFLDNEKPNQKELDTVSVLQALRIAKEGKSPSFSATDGPLFSAQIPNL